MDVDSAFRSKVQLVLSLKDPNGAAFIVTTVQQKLISTILICLAKT